MTTTIKNVAAWWLCGLSMLAVLSPNIVFLFANPPLNPLQISYGFIDGLSAELSELVPLLQVSLFELGFLALLGRPWLWLIIQLPFFLWLPFELMYIQRYAAPSSAHMFSILAETNSDEIVGYGGLKLWYMVAGWLLWVLAVLTVLFVFLHKPRVVWRHRARWWWLAATLSITFALVFAQINLDRTQEPESTAGEVCTAAQGCSYPSLAEEMQDSYPFGLPMRLFSYFRQNNLRSEYSERLKQVKLGIGRDTRLADLDETWVMVIGESSRAANWSLGGYERDTNPLLSHRDNLVWFDDAVSMAANTRVAVPLMLSHTSISDLAADKFMPSWITAFKEAGFYTYWFSVQIPVGNHDTSIGIYANLVDETRFLNMGTYRSFGAYDTVLLDTLRQALSEKHKKKLIILHTLGSHAPYQRRYSPEFNYFNPSLSRDSGVGVFDLDYKNEIRNTYDNSIRYTDYFLDQVIGELDSQPGVSAMWYASDHGQTLVDDGCKNVGHGFRSRNNFHIPLLFWFSKKYAEHFPEGAARNRRIETPVYMQDFYATFLGSAGFQLPPNLTGRQMLKAEYNSGVRFITVDGVARTDFDKEFPVGHFCP